jgi:hypothetical protein
MSYSVSTLLIRNLHDVFGENDPARRSAAIDEIFSEECVFYDPKGGVYRGRDEINRIAGVIKATHPDFQYQPIAEPEEVGNGGRVQWVSGRPGRHRLTPVPISSSCATVGLPPFTSFSTSYAELGSDARPSFGRFYRVHVATLQTEFELVTDSSEAAGE